MKNIRPTPTAEEFWNKACKTDELKSPADIMIEFAKIHTQAALKEASEKATIVESESPFGGLNYSISEDSILNSYSIDNIK